MIAAMFPKDLFVCFIFALSLLVLVVVIEFSGLIVYQSKQVQQPLLAAQAAKSCERIAAKVRASCAFLFEKYPACQPARGAAPDFNSLQRGQSLRLLNLPNAMVHASLCFTLVSLGLVVVM